jgi:hypothetical protein
MRRIDFIPTVNGAHNSDKQSTPDKKKLAEELKVRIEEKYLKDVDESVTVNWLIAKMTRSIMSKVWVVSNILYARSRFHLFNCCRYTT